MSESPMHKQTAQRIAKKYKTTYNNGKGADVIADNIIVEVETEGTVHSGNQQLRGYNKPVYIAGTNAKATKKAMEQTSGTTIGVMDNNGNIKKKSSRKKR